MNTSANNRPRPQHAWKGRTALHTLGMGGLLALTLVGCNLSRIEPTLPSLPPSNNAPPMFVPTITLPPGAPPLPDVNTPLENGCAAPPPGWVVYMLQNGDSLGSLGAAVGRTVEELAVSNCITNADALFAGETIYLPIYPSGYNPNPTSNGPDIGASG